MSQSRRFSIIESVTNAAAGFGLAVICNYYILPIFGFNPSINESTVIAIVFTVISIIRSYLLRRVFNALRHLDARRPDK